MKSKKTHVYDVEFAYQSQVNRLPVDAENKADARGFVERQYPDASILNVNRRKRE